MRQRLYVRVEGYVRDGLMLNNLRDLVNQIYYQLQICNSNQMFREEESKDSG